jgi:hypothetical protein
VDPAHDHLFRPYVPYICSRGRGTHAMAGAASFTIYTRTKEFFRDHHLIDHTKLLGCAAVGGIGGAMAGSLISLGSAREFPSNPPIPSPFSHCEERRSAFELVKVTRPFTAHCMHNPSTADEISLAGSAAAGIHDRREERDQAGETPEHRLCCT